MTLYEIQGQYAQLADMDMETDADVSAFLELLGEINDAFEVKVENYCKLLANLEADESGYMQEIARLEKSLKSRRNKRARIRDRLEAACKEVLQTGESMACGTFKVLLKKNPPKVNVYSPDAIGYEYLKSEPDIAKIKEALKNGETVSGAELVQGVSLQIS